MDKKESLFRAVTLKMGFVLEKDQLEELKNGYKEVASLKTMNRKPSKKSVQNTKNSFSPQTNM